MILLLMRNRIWDISRREAHIGQILSGRYSETGSCSRIHGLAGISREVRNVKVRDVEITGVLLDGKVLVPFVLCCGQST